MRGIVAGLLGYKYHGIELRAEQVAANEEQRSILDDGATTAIAISMPMLKQLFHPCDLEYVTANCRGRCCQGTDGIMVTIHPTEAARIEALGATVTDGFVQADSRGLCPFKTDAGRCRIHDHKPFGCAASPFTLNENNTLIVRNRYRCLKCYKADGALPAYIAHRWSLVHILGEKETQRVADEIEAGAEKITAHIKTSTVRMLRANDDIKHGRQTGNDDVQWTCGDSMELLPTAPAADFIFSCPPYGDLERYSDDPADLSTMEYHTFMAAYKRIILRCAKQLKPDRFACFVVGDFRDKRTGNYRGFVADTITAFRDVGLELYNEAILVTAVGSLPIRITRQFESGRKFGKTHQNVLVFVKGSGKRAAKAINAAAPLFAQEIEGEDETDQKGKG